MPTTTRKRTRPGDLIEAVKAGDEETVRRLIDAGSDIKERDDYGRTALMFAAANGHETIVSLLIEKGGVKLCEARNNGGGTALMAAAYYGRESIARQLLGVVGADGGVHAREY